MYILYTVKLLHGSTTGVAFEGSKIKPVPTKVVVVPKYWMDSD